MTIATKQKKIVWSRLKNMRCPKCNTQLISSNFGTRAYGCEDEEGCGFYMRLEAFERVVKALYAGYADKGYKPRFGDDVSTLEFLNNYGRNKESADFSGDESLLDDNQ